PPPAPRGGPPARRRARPAGRGIRGPAHGGTRDGPPPPAPRRGPGHLRPRPTFVSMEGKEPDPRFTLANERTFLTWLSTSLALTAAGVAIAFVPGDGGLPWIRTPLAVTLVLLGALAAATAYPRWRRIE